MAAPFLASLAVAEQYADGAATADELESAEQVANEVYWETGDALNEAACHAVLTDATEQGDDPKLATLYDAADAVGATTATPVRAADAADNAARNCENGVDYRVPLRLLRDIFGNPFRSITFAPEWRTDTAVSLAKGMYESRDFAAMPILADALQDAGCNEPTILEHCREEGAPHVRGCWVVDLVLGRA